MWNQDPNKPHAPWKYAGAVDIPLSEKGIKQAMQAGRHLKDLPIDVVYCSMLIRAQTTTLIALATHEDGKAPLLVRDTDSPEARGLRAHTRQMSEGAHQTVLPVYCSHLLNERNFGILQGMYEWEQKRKYSKEDLNDFRKEWNIHFPGGKSSLCFLNVLINIVIGESQAEVYDRTVSFFERHIRPQLVAGKNVLICCHGFVVRALVAHILRLNPLEYRQHMLLDLKHDKASLLRSANAIPRVFKFTADALPDDEPVFIHQGQFTEVSEKYFPQTPEKKSKL